MPEDAPGAGALVVAADAAEDARRGHREYSRLRQLMEMLHQQWWGAAARWSTTWTRWRALQLQRSSCPLPSLSQEVRACSEVEDLLLLAAWHRGVQEELA